MKDRGTEGQRKERKKRVGKDEVRDRGTEMREEEESWER